MLQVKHLTISHKKDLTALVEDLSFVLGPGDRAAIIGEEGNGKSTLLKLLYEPALVEGYVDWSGEIIDQGCRKGYLAQELPPEELELPVLDYCRAAPAFEAADPREISRTARQLGLDEGLFYDWRPLSTLSGGERVKLRLALLLLAQPDLLLLDEPSNDLDVDTVAWLEGFLLSCPVPVLYVSHDQLLLTRTANVVIHLERLRRRTTARCTVAHLDYAAYTTQRQAAFAQQEQISRKEHADYQAKLETYRKIRDKVDHQQATISRQDPTGAVC